MYKNSAAVVTAAYLATGRARVAIRAPSLIGMFDFDGFIVDVWLGLAWLKSIGCCFSRKGRHARGYLQFKSHHLSWSKKHNRVIIRHPPQSLPGQRFIEIEDERAGLRVRRQLGRREGGCRWRSSHGQHGLRRRDVGGITGKSSFQPGG